MAQDFEETAPPKETYLGDGVYASFDGFQIKLRTFDGISTTNVIYLDPYVQVALVKFIEHIVEDGEQS